MMWNCFPWKLNLRLHPPIFCKDNLRCPKQNRLPLSNSMFEWLNWLELLLKDSPEHLEFRYQPYTSLKNYLSCPHYPLLTNLTYDLHCRGKSVLNRFRLRSM